MKKNNSNDLSPYIDWKQIRKADSTIPTPFRILLDKSEDVLEAEEIIRFVPNNRLVVFGRWREKPVVAKLFFSSDKKRHLKRELFGINALMSTATPTPKLLWEGTALKYKVHIMMTEQIVDAFNLDIIWQAKKKLQENELKQLMRSLTIELATQHVVGIVQEDLHMKNFLIDGKKIYSIDGGSITQHEDILPKEKSINHFALFLSQLGANSSKLQQELFQIYAKARGWIPKQNDIALVQKSIRDWNEERWNRYNKKLFRNSTSFSRIKKINKLIMFDRSYESPEFHQLLKNPNAIFLDKNTKLLKDGNSSTVAKIKINDRYFVIKRNNIKSFWHWLRRCTRPSRAADCWAVAQSLRLFDIATAKPIAFIEKRFFGLRGKSYFIMEYIDGPHLGDYFAKNQANTPEQQEIAEKVVNLFVALAKLKLTHGDLKMTNILIEGRHPVLIDLDGVVKHKTQLGLKRAFKKEIKRFMKNWHQQPSVLAMFKEVVSRVIG